MNLDEYQNLASRTIATDKNETELLINMQMGLSGETGEISDHMKKALFQGHEIDLGYIKKELGDIMWYIALGATALDINLSEIAQMNIDKLNKRYPNGFEAERSVNRDD